MVTEIVFYFVVLIPRIRIKRNMSSIFVVTVTLVLCTIGVESQVQVPCRDLSSNIHFRGDNIVLNRPVSHTPGTYLNDLYNARLAADGNCNTRFNVNPPYTCSLTNKNNGISPTWTVTFDKSYQITGIVIYNRNRTRERLSNFTVYGACDGAEKVVLYNDAGHNNYQQEVILIEIIDLHVCSTISIQIPQLSVSGHVQYLHLCEVQVYTAVCSKLTIPFVTNISPDKPFYNKDDSLKFECRPGYPPSPSNRTLTCCGVDTFCPSPVCERVYCQLPTQPDNGNYLRTSAITSLEYGTNITGVCDTGYKTEIFDTRRTCQQNGAWSGQDLVCISKVCTPPARVQHGYYTYTNNGEYNYINETYNTNLTGNCTLGYKLTNPSSTLSCGWNESWIGNLPKCNIVKCDPPVAIQNGYYRYANNTNYTKTTEEYSKTLFAECNFGFKLSSPSLNERRCSQYGNWSGRLAVCEHITCPWPVVENGNYTGKKGPFYYNDQLTPTCYVGYSLSNNDTIVCGEYGWINKTAMCVPCSCITTEKLAGSFSTSMFVGIILGSTVFTAFITTVIVYFVIKRCTHADKKPNNLYGDLAMRNTSNEGEYSDLQNAQQNYEIVS